MRYILLFLLYFSGIYANTLRIENVIPFGVSSLRLDGNRPIQKKDIIAQLKLNETTSYIDLSAVFVPKNKKEYNFSNKTQIVVAQNDNTKNKERLRIVVTLTPKTEFEYKINGKTLYVYIKEKNSSRSSVPLNSKPTQPDPKPQVKQPIITTKPPATPVQPPKATAPIKPANTTTPNSQDKKNQPNPILVSKSKPSNKKDGNNNKRIIMLDPGHGGKDCGAQGVAKTCEKIIVLSIAQLVAKELDKSGHIVYMTRNSDVFIELQRRTEMANEVKADLFISIHANSMPEGSTKQPKGVETYFLSTARSERARTVAANENQGQDFDEKGVDILAKSLINHRIPASTKLGMEIQDGIIKELKKTYKEHLDGGVREGPFWVLVGAKMASVLVEVGYNSHPIEAQRLKDKAYQSIIANGIVRGINRFIERNPSVRY
ncbi:N-acetylmuramoyl-L-alanine amidase [Helicobacter muridarum]|uniref:N-acetylmuramoyl-L-alanine amidase n=1 Tax=Helicobacter muridarum TaxID=216 RepID=A0A099TYI7_9HELI|nr:N-acetylmuramoyl-L-alanine amidase [Helicobacter muridarum]TLE01719.1 N-acetylmuramoyl-L-alanine amidase [Helicobacter muridarum]STQ86365.1 N-acetylmuramoyl-L-alanine amidase [Helicobacter muridarum]